MTELSTLLGRWFDLDRGDLDSLHGGNVDRVVARRLRFNRPAPAGTVDGAVEVLVVENQGVWLWGRDGDGRYVEKEDDPGADWHDTGENSEEFWLHQAAFDAVCSLPASRSAQGFDQAAVRRIEQASTPLPCRAWRWPGTGHTMSYRGASVVMTCGGDGDVWVVAAAPTEADLGWLDELDLTWDESDSRRGH